jgi:hypothetical protein
MSVRPTATALLLSALAALCASGCKLAPVDDNREPDVTYLVPLVGPPAALPADVHPAAGAPQGFLGPGLGPAAREAVKHLPHGFAGGGPRPGLSPGDLYADEVPVRDRWRVGFPAWARGSQSDSPYDVGAWYDPYHQNWLKGDYPVPGTQNWFLNIEATSLTRYEARKVPTPSSVFPRASGAAGFYGKGNQTLLEELVLVSADLFHGETAFKPVDLRLFVRGAFNWNLATARENLALFADPMRGTRRSDQHAALQQAFLETTLASVGPRYDVVQLRVGTQLFNSDFRGFLFFDEALGARVFGSLDDNRWQWNVGYFRRFDKDTNSGLNHLDSIKQHVFLVNLYRQDVLEMLLPRWDEAVLSRGLTSQVSLHTFRDGESVHYDKNDFLVRPRAVGTPAPKDHDVWYLGWNNDGHVGRINISSALYGVWGDDSFNEIAGKSQDVRAMMAALELSIDVDWMRFRVHGFYQSGDDDPEDGRARGFDSIFDVPVFAGGEFGFWNRNAVRLTGSGVGLVQRFSLLNSLRSSKDQGQPSFVNPGLLLGGVGYDAQLTPHLKLITNASYLRFDHTDTIEYVLGQADIGKEIGYDISAGLLWRPLLTDNVIVKGGVASLVPGKGFRKIYGAETLYAYFAELILTW